MWFGVAFLILLLVVGSTWWMGLWSNFLNLVNFFLAALCASAFYENVAWTIEQNAPAYTYLADFLAVWLTFFVVFVFLRVVTDVISRLRLKFDPITEYFGRSLLSLWLALSFIAFTFFTLHLAPLPPDSFQTTPDQRMIGVGPDRLWLGFIQSRSRGALSAYKTSDLFDDYDLLSHPDDLELDARVFDPQGKFIFEHRARRVRIANKEVLLE
ncbi:MAG TPA: hypothetical protein PKD54_08845 [Pirellulaceae bacterium]|nr:hypothetical protein [Pirellulaceae bacterium]